MNRKERRAYKREQYTFVAALPDELTLVPPNEYPKLHGIVKVWRSRKYLAQLYEESRLNYPGLLRLSVCRSTQDVRGGWLDGLTWDELQAVKRAVGFGDWYAIEVYPRDVDVINVANFRHLWLLPVPLPIGWFST